MDGEYIKLSEKYDFEGGVRSRQLTATVYEWLRAGPER